MTTMINGCVYSRVPSDPSLLCGPCDLIPVMGRWQDADVCLIVRRKFRLAGSDYDPCADHVWKLESSKE